jgi:hypothetical protein
MMRHPLASRFVLCAVPGAVAFLTAALVSVWVPAYPNLHDDFANLLIADTLLHGRLTNPTPPSHELLQTFHVVVEPTYAGKFPIGTGAFLALGQLLFGAWHTGVWIAAGIACASLTWMLLAELPLRWAWTFGMFAALHPMWQTGWSQEYTHGWLAITAMSLVLGGLLRMRRSGVELKWSDPLAVACGLVMGIFSRPFETAILSLALGAWIAWGLVRQGALTRSSFWTAIAPGSLVLLLGFGLQGTINRSVTGSWLKLPYQLHEEQYGVAPVFIWQKPHEPTLGHRFAEQSQFHRGWSMESYSASASWSGYVGLMGNRVWHIMKHWGWILAIAPLAVLVAPRQRAKYGMVLVAALAALGIINGVPWFFPTYVAPLIPVAVLLTAVIVRRGSHQRHKMVMIGLLLMQTAGLVMATRSMVLAASKDHASPSSWFVRRADAESDLLNRKGNHLVIVRYASGHDCHHEWVFNRANPAEARIVWARWDPTLIDQLLIDYPNRSVWWVDVDRNDSYQLQPHQQKDPSTLADGSVRN